MSISPTRPFLYKRCYRCQVSPLARDFDAIWGTSDAALESTFCLACRVHIKNTGDPGVWKDYYDKKVSQVNGPPEVSRLSYWESTHRRKINLVYIPKIAGVPTEYLGKWMLPPGLGTLMVTAAGTSANVYLTDGERVWYYWGFPGGHSKEYISSMDEFIKSNDITMIADGVVHTGVTSVTKCTKCLRTLDHQLILLGESRCWVCQAEDEDAEATLAFGAY